jgi:hypothetical protein
MYGIDESGYYHIEIPYCHRVRDIKRIMSRGQVAEFMVKAADLSFDEHRPFHVKIEKLIHMDYYKDYDPTTKQYRKIKYYNFRVLIIADGEMTGTLAVDDVYCDACIILDLKWGDKEHDTLKRLEVLNELTRNGRG